MSNSATPWTAAHEASLSITNSWSLLKFMSIESVMPSNHLILCCPLLLPASIFPSIRVFSSESGLHIRGPKYWSFSFSISPSSKHSGSISFKIDWFDLLAAQGTLKSLLQHHSSEAKILRRSAFFIVQLSHPHMTTGETVALTRRTEQRSSPTPPTGAPLNPCSEVWRCLKPLTVHLASDTASPPGGLSTPGPTALSPQSSKKD